jgi:DNA topoisomerase-1
MMEEVSAGKRKRSEVLEEARRKIEKISSVLKRKEKKIGDELTKAVIATQDKQSILGKCVKCEGTLKVHKNWRTGKRFAGCTGYKKGCRVGFPLPREGIIMSTEKECEHCKTPVIQVRPPARRPFRMCLDPECETKKEWLDKEKLKRVQAESKKASRLAEKFKCEKCGKSFSSQRAMTLHLRRHAE